MNKMNKKHVEGEVGKKYNECMCNNHQSLSYISNNIFITIIQNILC